MTYRTKIEISAVQQEVQMHLEQLRKRGFRVPTVQKPNPDWINREKLQEVEAGFAESVQKPIEKNYQL